MTPAQFDTMVKAMEVKEGNFAGKSAKLCKPKSVELREMVQQAIPKEEVHVTSGDDVLKLKTDVNGTLPDLYPDLFMADLNFHFGDPAIGIGREKIGTVSSKRFKNNLTFVTPYYFLTSNARAHETKVADEQLVHIVRSGETLTGIASKYGAARDDLASANNITDVNKIFGMQHLKISGEERSPTLTPSGAAWCNRFLGSNSLDSLNAEFKPKVKAFIAALKAQGITVKLSAACRPVERSYLMYNAFQIARGVDATQARTWPACQSTGLTAAQLVRRILWLRKERQEPVRRLRHPSTLNPAKDGKARIFQP